MKKGIMIIVLLLLAAGTWAQQDAIDKYFSDLVDDDNFTNVTISSMMFELLMHVDGEDEDEQDFIDTITKLKSIRMLVKNEVDDGSKDYQEAIPKIQGNYQVLMNVDDNDEDMTFYIMEENGTINELLMGLGGKESFLIMSLVGDINLNQIAKLSRNSDIKGIENLKQLEEK